MSAERPLVSVITATYNWSSVLRYAIESVLWQTFQDWELIVVGDACTDDSEQVVASFGDPRIRWHNLPENYGSQSGPNNKGLELASGEYIAYHGHDDLWYFDHLQVLVDAMQSTGCDLAFTVSEIIVRPDAGSPDFLLGLSPDGSYQIGMHAPPSSWMHKASLMPNIGGWRDYRALRQPVDVDVLLRAHLAGKKLHAVPAMTVVKFPSGARKDSYVTRLSHEQADFAARIRSDPEFRYHELLRVVSRPHMVKRVFRDGFHLFGTGGHGDIAHFFRAMRGLPRVESTTPEPEEPLHRNRVLLQLLNARADVGPVANRVHLFTGTDLPADGLFLGFGWHSAEEDDWGQCFRWMPGEAEIVVTKPSGLHRRLFLHVAPGPGVGYQPFVLDVLDASNTVVASARIARLETVEFDLPVQAGEGSVFKLRTGEGGQLIDTDPRILNMLVYQLGWVDPAAVTARQTAADLQAALDQARRDLAAAHATIDQLTRFRRTSLRYWVARFRASPKLRRWLRLPP